MALTRNQKRLVKKIALERNKVITTVLSYCTLSEVLVVCFELKGQ